MGLVIPIGRVVVVLTIEDTCRIVVNKCIHGTEPCGPSAGSAIASAAFP